MEKRLSLTLFRAIIVLFSCVLLVFTMLNTRCAPGQIVYLETPEATD